MITAADDLSIGSLFAIGPAVSFEIPRYQREYIWKREQWDNFYEDLSDNENGYFIGSIICINTSIRAHEPTLQVVDGQQRLITLSILCAALYQWLKAREHLLDEEQRADLVNLRRYLYHDEKYRLRPQLQGKNQLDYYHVLGLAGVAPSTDIDNRVKQRRIHRAFTHFQAKLKQTESREGELNAVMNFRRKILEAVCVKIEVNSTSDAYTLFESLNNRGVPLTAVDLIKNTLLANLGRKSAIKEEVAYSRWSSIVDRISPELPHQERFLRQYYNASRRKLNLPDLPIAKRANLIDIYEKLIERDGAKLLDPMDNASRLYASFGIFGDLDIHNDLKRTYRNLNLVQGAPAYTLLLSLSLRKADLRLGEIHLQRISELLISFFVRRNLTGLPSTNRLDSLFITISDAVSSYTGDNVVYAVKKALGNAVADDDLFVNALRGPIYEENENVARFILCHLEEQRMNKENRRDLWLRDRSGYIFTIEHILPQSINLRSEWMHMLANGDERRAQEIQVENVHKLGNLTLTAFNRELSDREFALKRDLQDSEQKPIGYKNGLWLNSDLRELDSWNEKLIIDRTERLIDEALRVYKL